MPLYVDKNGIPRQVHNGYEGEKYREYMSVRGPVNYKRWAKWFGLICAGSYVYLSIACLFEENYSQLTREARKDALLKLKSEDEATFNAALSQGLIRVRETAPVETPVDIKEVFKMAFPKDL
eukprot:TRINITY_DN4323_c0_g1_i1.p1 TRINITY_DN4323_c0_g1~~TRINITY_DN4323_c0_g1_i1.p1  ORF type:complete len:135 (+),score=25.60 TRINITY_DN4323_c0_g1_i1:42-407(+)